MRNYYSILGISQSATMEEIKCSYKTLVKKYHPDLHSESEKTFFEEKMKLLNEAYEHLSDPAKKTEYDKGFVIPKKTASTSPTPAADSFVSNMRMPSSTATATATAISQKAYRNFVLSCAGITVLIFSFLFVIIDYFWSDSPFLYIRVGVSTNYLQECLGEPDLIQNNMFYFDKAVVITDGYYVTGWLDPYDTIETPPHKKITMEDIKLGSDIAKLIYNYGYPDSLSETLVLYDNIVIYVKNGYVVNVKKIGAETP